MSSLKNKLYNYEQTPPGKVWDKIAAALDESHISDAFPSKLYNTEVAPPPSAWDKIENSLTPAAATVVQMSQRRFTFLRYAAAAVIIGLAVFGIVKWTGTNNTGSAPEVVNVDQNPPADAGTTTDENVAVQNNPAANNIQPGENSYTANPNDVKTPAARKRNTYTSTDDIGELEPIYAYEHTPNLADRYVMLMTPNGIVRVSKKLGDIVCCVAGEEQGDDCKDQLKKWQEKMAISSAAHSAGNFMDILSLVSSLSENDL